MWSGGDEIRLSACAFWFSPALFRWQVELLTFKSLRTGGPGGGGRGMTDEVTVEDAGGAGGAIVPTDPAAGASGQPLQVWLGRVVGATDAISPDDLFDGDLLARALIELERRTDGTATGGPGDATADEVFSHEDLGAALDRAGLLKECAGALDALTRGFNDWNGRDQDAPLRILAAVPRGPSVAVAAVPDQARPRTLVVQQKLPGVVVIRDSAVAIAHGDPPGDRVPDQTHDPIGWVQGEPRRGEGGAGGEGEGQGGRGISGGGHWPTAGGDG